MQRGDFSVGHGSSRTGRHAMKQVMAQMVGFVTHPPAPPRKRAIVVERRPILGAGVRRVEAAQHA